MTKDEWIKRCATRYQEMVGMSNDEAISCAESSLENLGNDVTETPEDAVDEDLKCWQD